MSADVTATFALDVDSNAPEVGATAAQALEALGAKIQEDVLALRGMQKAMQNLKGGGAATATSMAKLKDAVAAQKAKVAGAQQAFLGLGGGFKAVAKAAVPVQVSTKSLGEILRGVGGPIGSAAQGFAKLSALVGGGGMAAGILLVGAALVGLTVAAAAAGAEILKFGFLAADTRRSELLQLDGLTKIRYGLFGLGEGYARAADKASFLQATIDQVSGGVAIGRDKVADYATQLYKMGLRSGNLQAALEGVATTAAVQGDAQAQAFAGWAAGAAAVGGSVRKLADDVKARLGGIAKQQMLSLNVQALKMHENFAMIFANLKIDGVLKAFAMITELFSQSTSTGRALKGIVDAIFPNFLGDAEGAGPILNNFFRDVVIGAQRVTLAFLDVRLWLKKTFGDSHLFGGFGEMLNNMRVGKGVAYALAGAIGATALALGGIATIVVPLGVVFAAAFGVLTGALAAVGVLGAGAIAIMAAIGSAVLKVYGAWSETDWSALGSSIVQGIANGIKSSATWVINAIKDLGGSVWKAFTDKLQMHSPSRLFRVGVKAGVGGGVVGGLKDSVPMIRSASYLVAPRLEDAVDPGARERSRVTPQAANDTATPAGGLRGGGDTDNSAKIHIENLHVLAGGQGAGDIAAAVKAELEAVLQGVAHTMGARRRAAA